MNRLLLPLFPLLAATSVSADETRQATGREPLVVFCVRHAEKADLSRDPPLTEAGRLRARQLAATLKDSGIQAIHSSDYRRTRDTAAPVAAALRLKTQIYDPRDPASLIKKLKAAGGRHLVAGHSNTIPELVKLLGGTPGRPIDEATEFNRLYLISVSSTGNTQTILLRYGAEGPPSAGK